MARIYPLYSSSKGNSTYIGSSTCGILIDAGVTYKKICEGLEKSALSIECVKAIFITHEHTDHIKGLTVLTKKHNIPIYATKGTAQYLNNKKIVNSKCLEIIDTVKVANLSITNFSTSHDAIESCGYKIKTNEGKVCCVCTDLGQLTEDVFCSIKSSDAVLIESNYDEKMLSTGSYPYYLKARISSREGHLSNTECAINVKKLIESGTTRIILGHLSQENNTPEVAEHRVLKELVKFTRDKDYILEVAPVQTQGKCIIF